MRKSKVFIIVIVVCCGAGLLACIPRIKRTYQYKKLLSLDERFNSVLNKSPTTVELHAHNNRREFVIGNMKFKLPHQLRPSGLSIRKSNFMQATYLILDFDRFAVLFSEPIFPGSAFLPCDASSEEVPDYALYKQVMLTVPRKVSEVFRMSKVESLRHAKFIATKH